VRLTRRQIAPVLGFYTWVIDNAVSRALGVAQQNMHRSVRS